MLLNQTYIRTVVLPYKYHNNSCITEVYRIIRKHRADHIPHHHRDVRVVCPARESDRALRLVPMIYEPQSRGQATQCRRSVVHVVGLVGVTEEGHTSEDFQQGKVCKRPSPFCLGAASVARLGRQKMPTYIPVKVGDDIRYPHPIPPLHHQRATS